MSRRPPTIAPPTRSASAVRAHAELDRQIDHLVSLGYAGLLGTTAAGMRSELEHLHALLDAVDATAGGSPGRLPFVLVIPGVRPEAAMPLTRQGDEPGYVDMRPVEPDAFAPLESLGVPPGPYLALDVATGSETLAVAPRHALPVVTSQGRTPLTIEEGIALITLFPGTLRSANCFQMLGSRRDDKRIPSLWVTKAGAPRLGWCFEGVPHTWLGAASCSLRLG